MTRDLRLELLILVVFLPMVGTVSISLGLPLAGLVLWALWFPVTAYWAFSHTTPPTPPAAAPATPQRPVVDPARALLDALGDDLTGGTR